MKQQKIMEQHLVNRFLNCVKARNIALSVLDKLPANTAYSAETRDEVKHTAKFLINTFKGTRATKLRQSLKRDLVVTINEVCKETITLADKEFAWLDSVRVGCKSVMARGVQREYNKGLVNSLQPVKSVVVAKYGNSAWATLETLVCEGFMKKSDLGKLGIEL